MTDAVIVSTARTAFAKSWRGALNMTYGATLGGHVVQQAVARAGIDPAEVEDVLMGCALDRGHDRRQHRAADRLARRAAGQTAGVTVNRFCSSGLQTIAMAAQRVITEKVPVIVAGGLESISCVQNEMNTHMRAGSLAGRAQAGDLSGRCSQTAEQVAKRYGISRERQDEYGVRSQQRAAAARAAGKFKDEIAPMTVTMGVADEATSRIGTREVTISATKASAPTRRSRACRKIRTGTAGRRHHGGQREPVLRRRERLRRDGRKARRAARPEPAGHLPRLRGGRLRAGRDGHRPGVRRTPAAGAHRREARGHRTCGSSTRPSRYR